jgi:CRISPR/Cas system CMR subunit Cmr6 (Cas7 group RAMP superfamily)
MPTSKMTHGCHRAFARREAALQSGELGLDGGFGGGEWAADAAGYRTPFGDHQRGGCLVFYDAWWDPANHGARPLDLDVMTVHHAGY